MRQKNQNIRKGNEIGVDNWKTLETSKTWKWKINFRNMVHDKFWLKILCNLWTLKTCQSGLIQILDLLAKCLLMLTNLPICRHP